jgi:hypothetical protein
VTAFGADRLENKELTGADGPHAERPDGVAGGATLDDWQARLSSHFAALAAVRNSTGWPLFALEHGLSGDERGLLSDAVRRVAETDRSLDASPLPWIVYAAEVGYGYSGEEYWYTFKAATPKWPDSQRDRDRIRYAFRAFAKRFGGAEPSGAWAGHFGIIAWPITHSILPRDLQRQLAEVLFDARLSFRAETFASAESLGEHLFELSGGASSRFREFAKDTALLGQIALALLLHDSAHGAPADASVSVPIHAPTLERIIADLNAQRDARDWLIEARNAARFRIRGLGRIPFRTRETQGDGYAAPPALQPRDELRRLLSRPRFMLRRGVDGRWYVWVQFPNLSALLPRMPRARDVLARTQGRVGTSNGPILAAGRILSESWPSVRLADWPTSTASLLHFDGAPPELRVLLDASFRIPPGDNWLFLIGADGQARELTTRVLRPGESYLLLQRQKTEKPAGGLIPTDIACVGVHGLRIDVPVRIAEHYGDLLAVLGLEVARTLEVWPIGIPIPDWSGDGTAEVLAGEPLTLALRTERPLSGIAIAVDGTAPSRFSALSDGDGDCAFIVIPPLPDGRHTVMIAATTADDPEGGDALHLGQQSQVEGLRGSLSILVRTPRPTGDGGETGAMSFAVHPRAPSLEDLWEDRCELHVAAPGVKSIRCNVGLVARGASTPLAERGFQLTSPITTATWRAAFRTQVRENMAETYDEAHGCVIGFSAGTLGCAHLSVERDFTPLRWVVRDGGAEVVLLDAQADRDTTVTVFDAQTPDVAHVISTDSAMSGLIVPNTGALFSASSASASVAVVAVPRQRITSLAELGQRPVVQQCRRSAADLERLVRIAAVWESARLGATSITSQRRDYAVKALRGCIIGTIAGDRWGRAEEQLEAHSDARHALDVMRTLVTSKPDEKGIVTVLWRRHEELAQAHPAHRGEIFVEAVLAFAHSGNARELAAFAFRLATSSHDATQVTLGDYQADRDQSEHKQTSVREALEALLAWPMLLRAARLAVLLLARVSKSSDRGASGPFDATDYSPVARG